MIINTKRLTGERADLFYKALPTFGAFIRERGNYLYICCHSTMTQEEKQFICDTLDRLGISYK